MQAVLDIFRGKRPDITPAQIVSGIPILAELLHSFGVYTLSAAQQGSLSKAVTWALVLVGGDSLLRIGRAHAEAKVNAAALTSSAEPPQIPVAAGTNGGGVDTEVEDVPEDALPTDEQEFAQPPTLAGEDPSHIGQNVGEPPLRPTDG